MSSSRVLRNSLTLIATRIATKLATTLVIIFVARRLGSAEFGTLSSLLAFQALFALFEEFGLTVPLIRAIAQNADAPRDLLGRVISLKSALGAAAAMLFVAASTAFHLPRDVATVFAISMFVETMATSVTRSFEGFERMEYVAVITVTERSVFCGAGIAVLLGGGGLIQLAWVFVASNVTALSTGLWLFIRFAGRPRFTIAKSEAMRLLKEALPFALAALLSVLYNKVDILFLTTYTSAQETGWYNAAMRVVEAQMFIPTAIVASLFPVMSRHARTDLAVFHRLYRRSLLVMVGLGILTMVPTYVASPLIVRVLFGPGYESSTMLLQTLSVMLFFFFSNFLLGNALIALGRERLSTVTIAVGAALSIVLNAAVVPRFGAAGASVVRLIAEVVSFGLQLTLLQLTLRRFKNAARI